MLEIKNVSKTYRPKKGVPVKALDNISLSFADTGLVFILGKSGSGKSTLLNVIGGLDKADSGEFFIKGKSSEHFKQGDFDAYRNTFIGFIFQEYNILNEFNVGQNIALAMELQGKKATSESLNKILEEVDLPNYATRKPNELSGGQKQRVAIARALIKEPEIIMADEPTGALDSNTGKQVFDTLKKLSRNKLVIVVSHDRDFAEYYGDRVIELADGKVISDITKYASQGYQYSEQVRIIDNSIVQIKRGSTLTDYDFEIIRQYIRNHDGDILISSDPRANNSFKQMAMLTDDGGKASFKETVDAEIPKKRYTPEQSKFIHSRLPFKNAFKIGASSLKTKPVRLFFTILLSFIAFALFGLSDTLASYNKYNTAVNSIVEGNVTYASFDIALVEEHENYTSYTSALGDNEIFETVKKETGLNLMPVYVGTQDADNNSNFVSLPNYPSSTNYSIYYKTYFSGITEVGKNTFTQMGFTLTGELPAADDEIVITKYQYEVYNHFGFRASYGDEVSIAAGSVKADNSADGLIGKHIKFDIRSTFTPDDSDAMNKTNFKIVGIVDTKLDENKYNELKTNSYGSDMVSYMLQTEFTNLIEYGPHNLMFVNEGVINKAVEANLATVHGDSFNARIYYNDTNAGYLESLSARYLKDINSVDTDNIVFFENGKTTLTGNEIIVSTSIMNSICNNFIAYGFTPPSRDFYTIEHNSFEEQTFTSYTDSWDFFNKLRTDAIIRYIINNGVPASFKTKYCNENQIDNPNGISNWTWQKNYYNALSGYFSSVYDDEAKVGDKIKNTAEVKIYYEYGAFNSNFVVNKNYGMENGEKCTIVGVEVGASISYQTIVVNNDFIKKYSDNSYGLYSLFIGSMPTNRADIMKLVRYSYDGTSSSNLTFTLQNQVTSSLANVNDMIEMLVPIFLYLGLGMAAFAALMLANFIAVSISNKKREIGILRAVGAKSSDVFAIFFNESFLIAMINFVLALVATIVIANVLNGVFITQLGLSITLLVFGIRQIALLLAISVGVAFIASFLPVMAIARKQPIDSIRER